MGSRIFFREGRNVVRAAVAGVFLAMPGAPHGPHIAASVRADVRLAVVEMDAPHIHAQCPQQLLVVFYTELCDEPVGHVLMRPVVGRRPVRGFVLDGQEYSFAGGHYRFAFVT